MNKLDGFGLEDILNEISATDVDLGQAKVKATVPVVNAQLPRKEKAAASNVVQVKSRGKKEKNRVRSKERDDLYYSTTMVNKKIVKLIIMVYPEMYIRDAVEKVLKEWVVKHKSEIQKKIEESLKL